MGWISGKIWTGYINHGINGVNNSILQRPRKKSTLPPSMSSLIDSKGTPWFISQEITWILLFNLTYASSSSSSSATTTASMAGVEKKHYCLWFFNLPSRCIWLVWYFSYFGLILCVIRGQPWLWSPWAHIWALCYWFKPRNKNRLRVLAKLLWSPNKKII
jgi:hypothetical protein